MIALPSGRRVRILSLEDALLWRQASFLLVAESVDNTRLEQRATQEGLVDALAALRRITSEIEQGRRFESWELVEIAKNLDKTS